MAGERTFPGLGMVGGFTPGTDGWGDLIDENFRKLNAICIGHVASRTTEPPLAGAPASGDEGLVYILPSGSAGTDGNIAFYDEAHGTGTAGWISYAPTSGMVVWVDDDEEYVSYVAGTGWQPLATVLGVGAGGGSGVTVNSVAGTTHTLLQLEFDDSVLVWMASADANTVTIPTGITGNMPVHIAQGGAGITTIAAAVGVTLYAADDALQLRAQYSTCSLMPLAADTYLLIGDLAVPA